jgi:hypothetical protein
VINITIERKHAYLVAVFLVVAALFVPTAAWASHWFSDVPDSNPFHDDIDFIADREITLGCGFLEYCPDDFVTREQMAAFMERLTRVATPSIITKIGFFNAGSSNGNCVTEAWTPLYEQQVVFSGGVYAIGDDDASEDFFGARVQFRANGGGLGRT